ncbi:UbiA prenyltransferase family [Amylostereum chailletii]|nr:UbiA prenyltransferase family [Amylostereum chailletii]
MPPLLHRLASFTYTAFLFTKSDIKTTVIPISIFAMAAAPITSWSRLPHVVFWIWFHLLHFNVSNQIINPDEDALNKRDRPLPAGRITLRNATILRWALAPLCFALSACYSPEIMYTSIAMFLLIVLYNELDAHAGHWLVRNAMNALGLATFEVGATLVGGPNPHSLDQVGTLAVCLSTGIIVTTYHVQDFKDEDGDRAIGRRTIPIMFPSIARWTIIMPLILWSFGIATVWNLDMATAAAFVALALYIGGRFVSFKTVKDDQVSFYWYNLWLSAVHVFPGYYRLMTYA